MSIVSFDGTEILADSICVMDNDVEFKATKVHTHRCQTRDEESYLVAFFTGSLGFGMRVAQAIFEEYEVGSWHTRHSFRPSIVVPDNVILDFALVDANNNVMFYYDTYSGSFSRLALQNLTFGFKIGVHLVDVMKAQGKSWEEIVEALEIGSNMKSNNSRYTAPPYTLTNVYTGQTKTIYE